jgi:hypothetical protein
MKLKLPKDVLVVLVTFRSEKWTKVSISSFFDHFIGDMLVVDNNPLYHEEHWPYNEYEWITNNFDIPVIKNINAVENFQKTEGGTHGIGVDIAVDYAKNNGYEYILHIEPDCVFYDIGWFQEMNQRIREENLWTIANGVDMKINSGAIWDPEKKIILHTPHICSSIWKINDTPNISFNLIVSEPGDTKYRELIEKYYDEKELGGADEFHIMDKNILPKKEKIEFILDTGVLRRIYYDSFGKGGHSTNYQGFAHFWLGSENFYYPGGKGNQNEHRLLADINWWERIEVNHGSPFYTEFISHIPPSPPIYKFKNSIIEKMRKYSPELVPPGYE